MKLLKVTTKYAGPEPEVILPASVTALLMQWFEGADSAEIKARTLAPHILQMLSSGKAGLVTDQELTDAVMKVLLQALEERVGFQSVEYLGGQRRDTLRSK